MISHLSKRLKTFVLIALTSIAVLGLPPHRAIAETVIDVRTTDPEMAAAIAKARASLPLFWASYEAPKPSEDGHSLKVRFPYPPNNGEHIWMADVERLPDGNYPAGSPTSRIIC